MATPASRRGRGSAQRRRAPAAPTSSAPAPAPDRATQVIAAVVIFYIVALLGMVALNRYTFILKSLVVPVLLLAALVSGRVKGFVNDWAVFLGAVVFFDFCRGLAFALTTHFELPMYLGYVIAWERWLCGGLIAPVVMQELRAGLADPRWWDRGFVLIYSSHFVFFLVFGLAVWYARRAAFRSYTRAILGVMYGGLLFYALVPTIPPWAAAKEFLVLPPIVQIVRTFYNVHMPQVLAAFDTNPIAAMPSLHAAIPGICALLALRSFGWRGLVVVAYTLAVWIAVIYLGEHYVVDVVAGALLALVVYSAVVWWEVRAGRAAPAPATARMDRWQIRPIVVALSLVAVAVGVGQLTAQLMGPVPITRAFVERELLGRSVLAHYYLGRIAFAAGDFAEAEAQLTLALDDLPAPEHQQVIRPILAASAARAGNPQAVIAALDSLRPVADANTLVLLGNAYAETHRHQESMAVLHEARSRFPGDPEPLYWLTRQRYLRGEMDGTQVEQTIEALRRYPQGTGESFGRLLAEVLRNGGGASDGAVRQPAVDGRRPG